VIDADGRLRYVVSPLKSSLTFEARSTLHTMRGNATGLSGQVDFALMPDGTIGTEPAPKMHVEFPVENLKTANPLQDREMWKLIGKGTYGRIAADLRELAAANGPNQYGAAGDITLAGRARRYNGTLSIDNDEESLTIDGDLSVDIRDFGLRPPSLLILRVDPVVKVHLQLVAARAA
jgi:hypothetical protein